MSLPKEGADALRECARILAPLMSPSERASMARNVESHIKSGTWLPVFRLPHLARLFYPRDAERAAEFLGMMQAARASGEFTTALPPREQSAFLSDLAAWPDCPPVPSESPLRYWLPESMHEARPAQSGATADAIADGAPNYEFWLERPLWTLLEAACLLAGREPVKPDQFDATRNSRGAAAIYYSDLKDAIDLGELWFAESRDRYIRGRRVRPQSVVAWARKRGIELPANLANAASAIADVGPSETASHEVAESGRWRLNKLERADDLRRALHAHLTAANKTIDPPNASEVLSAWMAVKPSGITRVTASEVNYLDTVGIERSAGLEAVAERIQRLIERV